MSRVPEGIDPGGSSPRPWGTLVGHLDVAPPARFIPTPVGNTRTTAPRPLSGPVHPHARGEHPSMSTNTAPFTGSSPRPWGTQRSVGWPCGHLRFIPTPVGNTAGWPAGCAWQPVHPHARGEHIGTDENRHSHYGSSPRPWGTHLQARSRDLVRWFIPTPVGNTRLGAKTNSALTVHPHARGEHAVEALCVIA